jgi:uncharacterized protein (TIGR00255 family)
MLRSMTGFGAATATADDEQLSVEIRSINQKFIDVKVRFPRELAALEADVAKAVKEVLHRGAVEVQIHRKSLRGAATVKVDLPLAREYARAFDELRASLGSAEALPARSIFEAEGVVRLEDKAAGLGAAKRALLQAVATALLQVSTMRESEGASLAADLHNRLQLLTELLRRLDVLIPAALVEHRQRLQIRIEEILTRPLDPGRLEQEVALLVDRTDVSEELSRLRSHLEQFAALLSAEGPAGRRLDFLAQEIHREVTTLANKSQSAEISRVAIELKAEAERIREQVQNIE